MTWTIENSESIYRVSRWSDGYFHIGDNGHLFMTPSQQKPNDGIDMISVIEEAKKNNVEFPMVLRFHDVLRSQVTALNETFNEVIKEQSYQGQFTGVYPIKVNQMREVVEEIVDAGKPYNYGLEAGSKAELLSVLAYNTNKNALTILNGYKDEDYIRLALLGLKLKRNVVFVVEKFSELKSLIRIAKEQDIEPVIGLRMRMMAKGRGKWESSSGFKAKFGLSIAEILQAVELLKKEDLLHCITMVHFHIGSQLTDIRAIKEAISEAGRIYAKLVQMDVPIKYVDVGGGLGVDYDGSRTISDSSKNYSLKEYVADIVDGLQQICDLESVPHPNIVTESGRAITAHHSCVITPVLGEINPSSVTPRTEAIINEHNLVTNMRELIDTLAEKNNPQETYNDATQLKEDSLSAFKLGILSLEEMAELETLFWQVIKNVRDNISVSESDSTTSSGSKFYSDELDVVHSLLSSQYLCNFSVFQSAADSWAIDQILPVVPIQRLNEKPSKQCALVDITCDSDGKIDKFIGEHEAQPTLPLHELNNNDYYLGLFLTGAYQDVMGDMHNLFGRLNEVHVFKSGSEPDGFYIEEIIRGSTAKNVLSTMQYSTNFMVRRIKKLVDKNIATGQIGPREGVNLVKFYEQCLSSYTYLKD
jgi:arginine decarboxylase